MGSFVVIFRDEPADAVRKLRDTYPDHFEINPRTFLVQDDLARKVSEAIGFDDDEDLLGVILRLNGTYWGRERQHLWDWLANAQLPV